MRAVPNPGSAPVSPLFGRLFLAIAAPESN